MSHSSRPSDRHHHSDQRGFDPFIIIRAWATSLEVFLHTNLGSRYMEGWHGPAVILLIPLYATLCEGCDCVPLMWFLAAYLVMCFLHRMSGQRRWRQGDEHTHSRYSGFSRLARFFPACSEITLKKIIEPLFVSIVGVLTCGFNEPLGSYLVVGALCLLVSVATGDAWVRRRATEMNDAVLDQEAVAERFREIRGDRF